MTTLLTSLVAYWPLWEASGTREDVYASYDLTDNNTVTQTTGKILNAAVFVAANSEYLNVASAAPLQAQAGKTFQMWINMSSSHSGTVLSKWGATNPDQEYLVGVSAGGNFQMAVRSGVSSNTLTTTDTYTTSTWYHVLAWLDGSDDMNIKINNGTTNNKVANPANAGAADFSIGSRIGSGVYFDGAVCEVAMWNRVLATAEMTALYNAGRALKFPFMDPARTLRGAARGVLIGA